MPSQFLKDDGRAKRRTVADALEVLRMEAGFGSTDRARIQIAPLTPFAAASVALVFDNRFVLLPATETFLAARDGEYRRRWFEITVLQGALAADDGLVTLNDGTVLKAVEVKPAQLPRSATPLDRRILELVLTMLERKDFVLRSIRDGLPEPLLEGLPDYRSIDFARLRELKAPPFKLFQRWLRESARDFRVSRQKYDELVAKVGLHVPARRGRRRKSLIAATTC